MSTREFTDKAGQAWTIIFDHSTGQRVKESSGGIWDLNEVLGVFRMTSGMDDLTDFWELLWYTIEPQAVSRGINAEQFGKLMSSANGLTLLRARKQFWLCWAEWLEPSFPAEYRVLHDAADWQDRAIESVIAKFRKQKAKR